MSNTDIVDRLRLLTSKIAWEAADEIERLRTDHQALLELLRRFRVEPSCAGLYEWRQLLNEHERIELIRLTEER